MSTDILGAVFKVYDIVGPTLLRQCDYVLFCNSHASALKAEIKKLKDAKTRLRHKIDRAESDGEIIEDDVWTWLGKADGLIVAGDQILQQHTAMSCCYGLLPDPKARYALGKRAKKSLPDIKDHLAEVKFDEVSYRPVVEQPVEVKVRSASSSTVRYVDLRSRTLVLNKIMAVLGDHERIGIYGMGGVGKTTLLKEVEKKAKESEKFDDVVSAFVSQTPDVEAINRKIINRLRKLEPSVEDETNKKTLLVLLDDLWNKLEVTGVQDSNKVKVKWVMTSRKQDLLTKQMNCLTTFPLGVLEEEEGWRLFAELVSSKVEDLKRNRTIDDLLKKCAGLPVSIEALATLWKSKRGLFSSDVVNMEELKLGKESIYGSVSLELSYNNLGDSDMEKQAKLMFRTIGLLGVPNVPILTLLKYGVGLGLFGGNTNDNIMKRAREEITTSLRILQDSSLLLESDDSAHVKIHDVVRDVAVSITSRDDHALIFNSDDSMMGWSKEKLRKSTSMSVPYSTIQKFDKRWKCPNMSIFTMDARAEQGRHVELPNSFFKDMVKLKVIHLKNAHLTSLPSSIHSDVCNLTTLCLHDCNLEDVAVIGELKSLEVLSFIGSDIAELPKEIGGLTKLRMLDLSNCSKLVTIKPGILEKLMRLEELYLKESFDQWEVEGVAKQNNTSLIELNKIQLSSLEVCIPDASTLPPNLPFGNLVHYKVLIGDAWDWSGEFKEVRTLKFKVDSNDALTAGWLQISLEKTQDLHLDGLGGSCESFHELCRKGFKELKHLHLQNSSSVKYIIWSTDWLACSSFTVLESMNLEKMNNLETIGYGLISSTSFSKLKVIKVQDCEKLKNLFSISLATGLTELEEIEVSNCNRIQEIVLAELIEDDNDSSDEDHKVSTIGCSNNLLGCSTKEKFKTATDAKEGMLGRSSEIILRNLRSLVLRNLPEMITFFTEEAAPSEFTETTASTFFNDQQVSSQRSKLLKLFPSFKFKKVQPSIHLELGNLGRLELEGCNKIERFINSKMLVKLLNLESLTIVRCDSLEHIFDLEEMDAKSGIIEILPKLSELKLRGLPKLQHIWKKNTQKVKGCPQLRTIEIHQCKSLLYLSNSSMCEGMENLTEINIVECGEMKTIFLEEDGLTSDASTLIRLTSLKSFAISKCPNLMGFLSSNKIPATHWCCGKQDLEDISSSFFNQKVFLSRLETLVLSDAGKFEKLWCNEVPDQSYCHLEFVHVEDCHALLTVFPASLMERLQNLKQLWVENCDSLKTVFDLAVMRKTMKIPKALMLTQLEEVRFSRLENLIHIMDGDSGIVVGFPSLKKFEVDICDKLIGLIPATTATTLLMLETLEIVLLKSLKEVIHGEVSGRNKRNVITFPNLTSLKMKELENLSCFSSKSYSLDFTGLKSLKILSCGNLKTFVKPPRLDGEEGSSQGEEGSSCTPTPRQAAALFNEKVQLPNLEELHIDSIQVRELWCNNEPPPAGSFCNLKLLKVSRCSRLRNIIPISMIHRLQNLESMVIWHCESVDDIFSIIRSTPTTQLEESIIVDVEKDAESIRLSKLTSLVIYGGLNHSNLWSGAYTLELPSLHKLEFWGTAGATVLPVIQKVQLPNLEELYIDGIQVEELWCNKEPPPAGSFCNLKLLNVSDCSRLRNIIPISMIQRLQNLQSMKIQNCPSVEDIFSIIRSTPTTQLEESIEKDAEDDEVQVVRLSKLTSLRIWGRLNHSNLLSGDYTLELPSLHKLEFWNTKEATVLPFIQKVYIPNLKELEIDNVDEMTELWADREPPTDSFCKLKCFTIRRCRQVKKIFPSFMLKRLYKLEKLVVKKCDGLETISELSIISGGGDDNKSSSFPFQNLTTVHVKDCPCLRNVFTITNISDDDDDDDDDGETTYRIVLPQLTSLRLQNLPVFSHLLEAGRRQCILEISSSLKEVFFLIRPGADYDEAAITQMLGVLNIPEEVKVVVNEDSFFGSTTDVLTKIKEALQTPHLQIIGILRRHSYYPDYQLERLVKEVEAKLFDVVLTLDDEYSNDANKIQESVGRSLGIRIYSEAGLQRRAQRLRQTLLTTFKHKRFLLILNGLYQEMDLEAVGIPHNELNLKQILVSERREVLKKMGAQQVVDFWDEVFRRWTIFDEELRNWEALFRDPVDSTSTIPSFFVGSNTGIINNIIQSLHHRHQKNDDQIIGLLGSSNITEDHDMSSLLGRICDLVGGREANLFDKVVRISISQQHDHDAVVTEIRKQIGRELGINYCSETIIAGVQERAQQLRAHLLSNYHHDKKRLLIIIKKELEEAIDLEAVGIPLGGEVDPKLLKVIIFSNDREVLNKMGAHQQLIDIGNMSLASWDDMVCHRILDGYVARSELKKLADECGSNDLAKRLAKKLKGQGLVAWANAFERLQHSAYTYQARRRVIDSL